MIILYQKRKNIASYLFPVVLALMNKYGELNLMEYELSIVTICYNCKDDLAKTLNSVESQIVLDNNILKRVEYLIVDGDSNDGTLEVAQNWKNTTSHANLNIIICSEKDKGIYDAMNKGIGLCKGKWVILFNAGDTFHSANDLNSLMTFLNSEQSDIVYANYCRVNGYGTRFTTIQDLSVLKKTMIFCHQATIVRKKLYEEYMYDLSYKLVADYAFFLRAYLNKKKFSYFDYFLIDYDVNGESAKQMLNTYKEIRKVRKDLLGNKLGVADNISYVMGLIKRFVLSNMPQKLRWIIVSRINNRFY